MVARNRKKKKNTGSVQDSGTTPTPIPVASPEDFYATKEFQEAERERREELNRQYNQDLWDVAAIAREARDAGVWQDDWTATDAVRWKKGSDPLFDSWMREHGRDPVTGERSDAILRMNKAIGDGIVPFSAGQWGGGGRGRPGSGGPGGGGSGGPGGGYTPGGGKFTGEQQSAFSMMSALLNQYGLGSLSDKLRDLIVGGVTDQATLTLELQNTNEWKQRFAGNERLRAAGLPVLSVAEYLSVERSYAQLMKQYGLPQGFYDDPSDFADLIGNSVSPAELNQRVGMYADLANREDPAIKEQLRSMGFGDGDLIAFMIDSKRAMPLIQRKYQEATIGGAARRAGLAADRAGRLVDWGVTEQQAIQGYGLISESLDTFENLADIHGGDFDQADFEAEVFGGDGNAARKRKRLASQERAAFSGSSGVGRGSLSRDTTGSF